MGYCKFWPHATPSAAYSRFSKVSDMVIWYSKLRGELTFENLNLTSRQVPSVARPEFSIVICSQYKYGNLVYIKLRSDLTFQNLNLNPRQKSHIQNSQKSELNSHMVYQIKLQIDFWKFGLIHILSIKLDSELTFENFRLLRISTSPHAKRSTSPEINASTFPHFAFNCSACVFV